MAVSIVAGIITVVGSVPERKLPLSVTLTFTVRPPVGAADEAVTVKVAGMPSSTDALTAVMVMLG